MGVQEVHNGFAAELGPTHVETLKAKGNLVRKMHRTSDALTLVLIASRELSVVVLPQAACLAKSGRLEDSKMLIGQVAQSCAEHHGPPPAAPADPAPAATAALAAVSLLPLLLSAGPS